MAEFLNLVTPEEAKKYFYTYMSSIEENFELILTAESLGRVLAKPIFANENIPSFARSTVDGYAVNCKDTFGASENLPSYLSVIGEVVMGQSTDLIVESGQATTIHTGGMLPKGANAVVMIENTQTTVAGEIEVFKSVGNNENVILAGEDVQFNTLIFSTGQMIRPGDIGALMALGITDLLVYKIPKIGIVSSGDEIVDPSQKIIPGQVRDINSYSLSALVQKHGAIPKRYGIVPDNKEELRNTLQVAFNENDMVIVTAGSSASVRDHTAEVIQMIGEPGVLIHGVNVKPGKPTILGICDGKPIIGLPGNPVSAFVIATIFLVPLIRKLRGEQDFEIRQSLQAKLTINIASAAGREDWIPAKLKIDSQSNVTYVEPIFYKSNLIFSIIKADGFLRIPPDVTGYSINSIVEVILN